MTMAGTLKIGTLLMQADLVQESDLNDSVQMAKKMKLPLGRVLVGNRFISDDVLSAALALQSLIRDKTLAHDIAVKSLKAINERGIGFEEALAEFGLHSDHLEFTAKLGQLLIDSGFITVLQRNEALQTALAAGLPIGRVLVLKGALSQLLIYAALTAQVMIRAGFIQREKAIEALKAVRNEKITFEKALQNAGFVKPNGANKIMLGELLIISDELSEVDFLTCLETSMSNDVPLGTVLIESGLITQEKLDRTLVAQRKVTDGTMSTKEAAEFIQQEDTDGFGSMGTGLNMSLTTVQAIPRIEMEPVQLLVLAKAITSRNAEGAKNEAKRTGLGVMDVLMARGLIDKRVADATMRCMHYYSAKSITSEEAILALNAWLNNIDEPVDEMLAVVTQRDLN